MRTVDIVPVHTLEAHQVRTTVELDDELVAKAREVFGGTTLKGMIEQSLREAVRTYWREQLRQAIREGSIHLDIDEDDLAESRRHRNFE
jgi:Arc/MetJ family transcription regulator